jgi:hypothetical protein
MRMIHKQLIVTRTPSSHSFEINLRYNQNTLEQTVLAVIAWTGLATCCIR